MAPSRKRSLSGFLTGVTVLLALVSGGCLAYVVASSWHQLAQAEENQEAVGRFAALVFAANRISAERGPSNMAMSAELGSNTEALARLATFREESDRAIDEIRSRFSRLDADTLRDVASVEAALRLGRLAVDRVASLPLGQRSVADTSGAARSMMAAVDRFEPIIDEQKSLLPSSDSSLLGHIGLAQAASDLREFAGRMGSYVIPYVIKNEAIPDSQWQLIEQTRGRILQLMRLLPSELPEGANGAYEEAMREARSLYLENGLQVIVRLVEEGRHGRPYSVNPYDVTSIYVPTMAPLERVRTTVLADMTARFEAGEAEARSRLLWAIGLGLVTATAFVALLASLRALTIVPLFAARQAIIELSQDRFHGATRLRASNLSELVSLSNALLVLSDRLKERHHLLEDLRARTETDPLTGLMSRQHFETKAEAAADRRAGGRYGMLYIDLDHFKTVNDTLGHHCGDALLAEVGRRLSGFASQTVLVGRLGGDEFAICCTDAAEAERERLACAVVGDIGGIRQIEGRALKVSCSVGLSGGSSGTGRYRDLCREADAALYVAKSEGRGRFSRHEANRENDRSLLLTGTERR